MSPLLKYHSENVKLSSTSRSRLRRLTRRRRSASPSRKAAQNASQIGLLLIFVPPNAPGPPRAIPHATCGPVNASMTVPDWSSTFPCATSPAAPEVTLTVQFRSFGL